MPVFNYARREVNAKIVYYGPGLSGKTTNLQYIHGHLRQENRGRLVSIATQTDRTLFFDFLPVDLGVIGGYTVRLHLYTVPGQVHYNATRKLVLKGVDGVVFVADSQRAMRDANLESYVNLERNLASYGKDLRTLPHLIQANKQDLPDVFTTDELGGLLNRYGAPVKGAAAALGRGVQETLSEIVRMVINDLRGQFRTEGPGSEPSSPDDLDAPGETVPPSGQSEAFPEGTPQPAAASASTDAGVRARESDSTPGTARPVSHGEEAASVAVIGPGSSARSRFTLRLPSGHEAELTVEVTLRASTDAPVQGRDLPSIEVRILPGTLDAEGALEDAEMVEDS